MKYTITFEDGSIVTSDQMASLKIRISHGGNFVSRAQNGSTPWGDAARECMQSWYDNGSWPCGERQRGYIRLKVPDLVSYLPEKYGTTVTGKYIGNILRELGASVFHTRKGNYWAMEDKSVRDLTSSHP